MIIDEDSLTTLETMIQSYGLDSILLNFSFTKNNHEVNMQKQFVPIYENDNIPFHFFQHILDNSLSIVLYDKNSSETKLHNQVLDITLEVLERNVAENTLLKIDTNLYENDIDMSNYTSDTHDDLLLKVISDTLLALQIQKKINPLLQKLDKNFIDSSQIDSIVKKYLGVSQSKVIDDIQEQYNNINTKNLVILKQSFINIKKILKELELSELLSSLFLKDDCHVLETQLSDEELYTLLYNYFKKSENIPLHKNAPRYMLEIQRETIFQNLYKLQQTYNANYNRNSLNELYEHMRHNNLSNITIDSQQLFLHKIKKQYLKYLDDIESIKEQCGNLMQKELHNLYNGVIEDYEEQLSSDYMGVVYGADVNGVTMDEVLEIQTRDELQKLKEAYSYNNHHEEMILLENFIHSNNELSKEEEEFIQSKIPATKSVKGKRSHLKKDEIKSAYKLLKKQFIVTRKENRAKNRSQKFQQTQNNINFYSESIKSNLSLQMDLLDESEIHERLVQRATPISYSFKFFKKTATKIKQEKQQEDKNTIQEDEKRLMNH